MTSAFRLPACVAGAATIFLFTACDAKPKPVADVLARDSTLALEIFGANLDSLSSPGLGDTSSVSTEIAAAETSTEPAIPAPISQAERGVTPPATVARIEGTGSTARRPIARTLARSRGDRRNARVVRSEARRSSARSERIRTGTMTVSTAGRTRTQRNRTERVAAMRTPSRAWLVLPSGSELELESGERICTNTSNVGDVFDATLSEPVIRANGTVIPSGAVARGEVTSVNPGVGKKGEIAINIQSITFDGRTYPLSSRVTHADVKRIRTGSRSAGKVAAGAGVGAILGQAIGRDARGTVIGATGGAAAGAVLAGRGRTYSQCVPDGGRITAELVQPLRIQMSD